MAINVPVDVDVAGLGTLEALDETLDEVSENRRSKVTVDTSSAQAAAVSLSSALSDAGSNVDELRKSLDFAKERAEAKRLEEALDAVAKLRHAGVDVEVEGRAELAELDKALNAVERRRKATVDVDVDGAVRAATRGGSAISEAFSGAFQLVAKNAILLTGVVGVALAALPLAGALAATGLVLAFGGAIAGLGILAAAQSEKVQTAFRSMADGIVKDMKRIAAPLENTLVGVAGDISEAFDSFAPALEKSFADMAPVLSRFSDQFFDAFENLEPAIAPLTDAFNELIGSIGPKLDGFFSNLEGSLTGLSEAISADPELFASLFVGVLNILPAVINGITGLANIFRFVVDTVRNNLGPAFGELRTALEPITSLFSKATGGASLLQIAVGVMAGTFTAMIMVVSGAIRVFARMISGITQLAGAIRRTWNNTLSVTRSVWASIRGAVSSAIGRVASVVTSGMARVVSIIAGVLSRIRGAFSSAWAAVRGVVSGGVNNVRAVVSSGLGRLVGIAAGVWSRVRGAFSRGVSSVVSVVRSLPGRILGIFGGLAGTLFSSGYRMISSLADGIRAGFSAAISAASSGLSRLRSFFPFSPAKRGPFAGSGYTTHSGEALVRDFAGAISKTAASVAPGVGRALGPVADAFVMPTMQGSGTRSTVAAAGSGGTGVPSDLVAALVAALATIQIVVTPGMDRRAMAELWLNGKKQAEMLA